MILEARKILKNQKGFSMIELVLTLVLASILSVAAIPRDSDALVPVSVDAASRKIMADLRLAQNLAMTSGTPHGFETLGGGSYRIYNASTGTVVTSSLTNTALTENLTADFEGVTFSGNYQVVFDDSGSPTTGGGSNIMVTNSGTNKTVTVSASTGYVYLP